MRTSPLTLLLLWDPTAREPDRRGGLRRRDAHSRRAADDGGGGLGARAPLVPVPDGRVRGRRIPARRRRLRRARRGPPLGLRARPGAGGANRAPVPRRARGG